MTGVDPVPGLGIFNTRSSPAAKTQAWIGRRRVQVVKGNQPKREDSYVSLSGSNSFLQSDKVKTRAERAERAGRVMFLQSHSNVVQQK